MDLSEIADPLKRLKAIKQQVAKCSFGVDGISMHQALPLIRQEIPWLIEQLEKAWSDLEQRSA